MIIWHVMLAAVRMEQKQKLMGLNDANAAQDSRGTKGCRAEHVTHTARTQCRQEHSLRAALLNKKHLNWKKIKWMDESSDFSVFNCCLLTAGRTITPINCYYSSVCVLSWWTPTVTVPVSSLFHSFNIFRHRSTRRQLWPGRSLTNNLASVPLPKVPSLPLTLPQMPSFSAPAWMGPLCENTYVWRGVKLGWRPSHSLRI